MRRLRRGGDKFPSPEPIKRPQIDDQPKYDGDSAKDISRDLRRREREWDFRWLGREGRERQERQPYDQDGDRASDAEKEGTNGPGSGGIVQKSFDYPKYGEACNHGQDDIHERERRVARRIYGERIPQPWEEAPEGRGNGHIPRERDEDVDNHDVLASGDARRLLWSQLRTTRAEVP